MVVGFFHLEYRREETCLNHSGKSCFIRGAAPNQQLQAGIIVIMWEEMQLRELDFKMPPSKGCSQVHPHPLCRVLLWSQGIAAAFVEKGFGRTEL